MEAPVSRGLKELILRFVEFGVLGQCPHSFLEIHTA